MPKLPRKLSLVVFEPPHSTVKKKYPFRQNQILVFLGEIPNMKGHCIVADIQTGKIHSGYHSKNFREALEEEI
jgi:hypothetical protein